MIRLNRKVIHLTTLVVICLLTISALYIVAQHVIESQEVEVIVSAYSLTITDPEDGTIYDTYTFTGALTLDGVVVSDKTVTLYISSDDGTTYVSTGQTDTTTIEGTYSISWTPTTAGTFKFKTQVTVP
ncbi:MAG: hypothetical protein OEY81_07240 [Candidatus Bathyarchaeota archaeon]|nr:hypothetical protein [Candidatus Bathyarchaeota archaeon]